MFPASQIFSHDPGFCVSSCSLCYGSVHNTKTFFSPVVKQTESHRYGLCDFSRSPVSPAFRDFTWFRGNFNCKSKQASCSRCGKQRILVWQHRECPQLPEPHVLILLKTSRDSILSPLPPTSPAIQSSQALSTLLSSFYFVGLAVSQFHKIYLLILCLVFLVAFG